jgi:hypothetical protein
MDQAGGGAMELREALTQISEIRLQLARTEVFRGYRALPVAFSGILALVAGVVQSAWIGDPLQNMAGYLTLWVGAAVLGACAAGAEMVLRARSNSSALSREVTLLAVGQFAPCLLAGGLVTMVLASVASEALWILPGIWQILFSLGIFASYRLLPRATFGVAIFYLCAGVACLVLARGDNALSPWAMALPFGCGQLYAAAVLYWTLERSHGE